MPLKDLTPSVLTTSFTIALFTAGLGFPVASQAYAPVALSVAAKASQSSEAVCTTSECEAEMRRLIRLARNGSGDAAAIVAMAYASGDGLKQSDKEAERYVRIGVRYRSAMATFMMSDWHRNGFILEQSSEQADEYLEQAIALNHPPALYQKATQLFASDKPEDFDTAINYLERASEANLVSAMLLLGRMRQLGVGVNQDLEAAGDLYQKLITAGIDDARPLLREVIADLEAENGSSEAIERFAATQDIERITVTGSSFRLNSQITGIVRRLTASGRYDSRSIGSRIRGVNCEDTGNCVINTPSSDATSISDVVGNN
ncbi:tetratricopeptide repeat protein [Aliidiomarina iranensis]|uniref:tetratricopeptide repeat protein n=1 Tax=Aliidiomarina iranensis TaxID=1434071 RepID=UPI0018E58B3B|nr:tetratricopeptide repeat protein [Aliidiomarina iranensis]